LMTRLGKFARLWCSSMCMIVMVTVAVIMTVGMHPLPRKRGGQKLLPLAGLADDQSNRRSDQECQSTPQPDHIRLVPEGNGRCKERHRVQDR